MDPLSIAGGFVSATSVAIQVQETLDDLIRSVKSAPEELKMIHQQLSWMAFIQEDVVRLFQDQNNMLSPSTLKNLRGILEQEMRTTSELLHMLRKLQSSQMRNPRLLWSFKRDTLRDILADLKNQTSTMTLLLQVMNTAANLRDAQATEQHLAQPLPVESAVASLDLPDEEEHSGSGRIIDEDARITHDEERDPIRPLPSPARIDLSNAYVKRLAARWKRYYDKLGFVRQRSYYVRLGYHDDDLRQSDKLRLQELKDDLLAIVLSNPNAVATSESKTENQPTKEQRLGKLLLMLKLTTWCHFNRKNLFVDCKYRICESDSNAGTIMPFTKDSFLSVLERLKPPPVFFRALFTGTPQSIPCLGEDNEAGFVFRTPMSLNENWTLGLSWTSTFQEVQGFLHGLQSSELEALVRIFEDTIIRNFSQSGNPSQAHVVNWHHKATHLGDNRLELDHPMNLPVILCEMLTESDSNGIKRHAAELYGVEFKTKTALNTGNFSTQGPDFEEMTRSLNIIISRLAFHDMRIQANRVFVDQIQEQVIAIGIRLDEEEDIVIQERRSNLQSASRSLRERLVHLKTEHQALGLEIELNQRIAQSQLEIVYNLVAQRDNRDNRSLAEISTEIAITTKDDSFAMRTIAIMSIAFLPGTFVASFFSMSMFNWQAPEGASVISSRFWIYWAVTGPLTFVVFITWFFWLRTHHKHDKFEEELRSRIRTQGIQRPVDRPRIRKERFWYPDHWMHSKARDEEKQAVEAEQERMSLNVSVTSLNPESTVRQRIPTAQMMRADTMPQGPLR